jgi:hypothetical protein
VNHNSTTIIKSSAHGARLPVGFVTVGIVLVALAMQAMAHGGFDHVIGTVVKVENSVLTVKTAKGDVDVKLNEKTEITRNDQKVQAEDLKPGTRVVVDVPEGSKDKVAHSVKVGVTGAPAHAPK